MKQHESPQPATLSYLAVGSVGAGFVEESLERGLRESIAFIGVDAGSTDPGPICLATDHALFSYASCLRDLRILLVGARRADVPLLIGSAGGAGTNWGVDHFADMIRRISQEEGLTLTLGKIYAEQDPGTVIEFLDADRVTPLANAPTYDADAARRSRRIVAVMGVEPFWHLLRAGADVVIAGRATDTAIYAAVPLERGVDPALAWHAAKIAECGASAAEPRGRVDVLHIKFEPGSFLVEPLRDDIRCTPMSVSAVQLHEVTDPYVMVEPGWSIDLADVHYEAVSDRAVRATGARATQMPNTNKLEGVESAGYQSMFVCAIRDPTITEALEEWLARLDDDITRRCAEIVGEGGLERCNVTVRVYGRDGVMGEREPLRDRVAHEVALAVDVVSPEEELTRNVIDVIEYAYMHGKSPHWRGHGTLAYPFSKRIFDVGEVYAFNVNHVLHVDDPLQLFDFDLERLG